MYIYIGRERARERASERSGEVKRSVSVFVSWMRLDT